MATTASRACATLQKNRRVIVEEQHSELFDRSKMVQRFTIPQLFSKQVTQLVFCGPFCFDFLALPSKKASKIAVLWIYLAKESQTILEYQIWIKLTPDVKYISTFCSLDNDM